MAWFAAEARMAQGDAELEAFLGITLPPGTDFRRPSKRAESRFTAWFDGKTRQMERARKAYEEVILLKQAHFAIAAAARIGQLFEVYAAQLTTAPVPAPPPAPSGVSGRQWAQDYRTAYCDKVMEIVDDLEGKAVTALDLCLTKSTQLSWYNEWSSLCEVELNQLRPSTYPLASEIRAQPGYVAITPPERSPLAEAIP